MSFDWPCSGWMRRSRDVRPAAQSLSFASPKERNQRKGDPAGCDPSLRCGQPAPRRWRGALQNSLRALRCAQTAAASQITKPLLPHAAQRPPRHRHVTGASRRDPSGRAIASLGRRENTKEGQGCAAALLTRGPGPLCVRRGAQRLADQGPRMFERSEFARTPPAASTAGCPEAKRRGRRQWGRLFFADFLLAKQKKVRPPPGGTPGSCLGEGTPQAQQTNTGAGP